MTPHKCPLCEGSSLYAPPLAHVTSGSSGLQPCHGCNATGIVWPPGGASGDHRAEMRREVIAECTAAVEAMPDFAGRTGGDAMEGVLRAKVIAALRGLGEEDER